MQTWLGDLVPVKLTEEAHKAVCVIVDLHPGKLIHQLCDPRPGT